MEDWGCQAEKRHYFLPQTFFWFFFFFFYICSHITNSKYLSNKNFLRTIQNFIGSHTITICERRIPRVQVKQTSSSKVQVCKLNVHLPHRELQGQLLSSGTEKGTDNLPVSDHMERCFITLAESLKWIFHLFMFLVKTMINSKLYRRKEV